MSEEEIHPSDKVVCPVCGGDGAITRTISKLVCRILKLIEVYVK